jgi:hypothetical protein
MRALSSLCLGLALGLAVEASAGGFPAPLAVNACGSFHVAADAMVDPDAPFTGSSAKECAKLCKHAARDCRTTAKNTATCHRKVLGSRSYFQKKTCRIAFADDPAEREDCLTAYAEIHRDSLVSVGFSLDGAYEDCDAWGDACAQTCAL